MAGDVRLLNTGQLLELSRRLRAAGGAPLRANFQRRIRRAAEPLHRDLQDVMTGMTIRSQGRSTRQGGPSPTTRPLRRTIAEAIRISVRTSGNPGARVWVDKGRLPPDLQDMPKAMNKEPSGRVRHPVFDNPSRWVNTWVTPLWWTNTMRRHESRMRAEVLRITDDIRRQLGG
ncbi:hypothetical protein KQY30_24970 [Streptomyces sp. GMY02]|uniref:hypothetical protein n=1 Tax=Streptomyces sp. GMY02 TaxID=1333528 RepID=UPI001C2BDDD5|nr:hypothetical protein [Streptomyces sp. GMY02]QXE36979.1 hypothetical protein KQY30_24970 [Streptomyces sp. GMY02]